jgi:hypothetical protein
LYVSACSDKAKINAVITALIFAISHDGLFADISRCGERCSGRTQNVSRQRAVTDLVKLRRAIAGRGGVFPQWSLPAGEGPPVTCPEIPLAPQKSGFKSVPAKVSDIPRFR